MDFGTEKLTQKNAKIDQKVLGELVRFLEFKGNLYQREKTDMFDSRVAKENGRRFRAECDRRLANMFRGLGVTGLDDIIRQTEENVRNSKTCKLCGLYCSNYHLLEHHRNSQKCLKRQATQKGEVFKKIPENTARFATCLFSITTGLATWKDLTTQKTFEY